MMSYNCLQTASYQLVAQQNVYRFYLLYSKCESVNECALHLPATVTQL